MEKDKDVIIVITDDRNADAPEQSPAKAEAIPSADDTVTAAEKNPSQGRNFNFPDVRGFITGIAAKVKAYAKELPRDLSTRFIKVSCAFCAAVLVLTAAAAFLIPKGSGAVDDGLERLKRRDSAYTAAKSDYDAAALENKSLSEELEEKKSELEEFRSYGGNLDKITESNAELEKTRDELKEEVISKQRALESLNSSLSTQSNTITTLSSGYYTVGADIAPGAYTITGTGSIAVANSGKSTANKLLKADGESFTLRDGDRVQIEGNAKLIPQ